MTQSVQQPPVDRASVANVVEPAPAPYPAFDPKRLQVKQVTLPQAPKPVAAALEQLGFTQRQLETNPEIEAFVLMQNKVQRLEDLKPGTVAVLPKVESLKPVIEHLQDFPDFYVDAVVAVDGGKASWRQVYHLQPQPGLPPPRHHRLPGSGRPPARPQTLRFYAVLGSGRGTRPIPANSVKLAWDPVTRNENGTPATDLAGYRVYYGAQSRQYTAQIEAGTATTLEINNLPPGPKYFAATAFTQTSTESRYSNEASKVVGR